MTHAPRTTVLLLLIGFAPGLAWGVSIGQRDTFEDGTPNGWGVSLGSGLLALYSLKTWRGRKPRA
jgi:hypothetical protein